jgi:hypothetical protein
VIRLVKTLVCVLLAAAAAQAQVTTANVKVLITGKRCAELKDIYLVINGDDLEERWVKLKVDPADDCRWKADLGAGGTISTSVARFSLRGSIARSDCQKADPNDKELSANLEFGCCVKGPLRNLSVKIEPPMPVTYVRAVRPFAGSRVPSIKNCFESATFAAGQGAIGNAQFTGEDVYLHLGPFDRKRQTIGLLLDEIVVDDGTRVLSRDGVIYRLIVQRAKGKSRSTPNVSSNAISVDIKVLGDLKLERAELRVIK